MYKEFDVVTLKSGERVTIVEVYDAEHFMVEKDLPDGKSEVVDISIADIKKE